ncbi:hypothetical protein ACQKRQ_26515 [Paraburkholderia sp. NPDC080076]|jgi:hypothetical protein|uniref:hypothetical protein n=1 Tax=Paraburkholderia sp. NPDC080076 TaxID=3390605 RepID=UPI003CFECBC4
MDDIEIEGLGRFALQDHRLAKTAARRKYDCLAALLEPGWAMSVPTDRATAIWGCAVHPERLEVRWHPGSDELHIGI